jgi:RNA 3'-terminal phosphate cyclase (ATP)
MIEIDGSYGEGGGQILRTSLALAAITGQAVHIHSVRAARRNPGLAPQHLTGLSAIATICQADVRGAKVGSTDVTFVPESRPIAGDYEFDVTRASQGGSAGSVTLIFQTLLLPLAMAGQTSHLVLKGGTHVPWSPSYHYLAEVCLPLFARAGIRAELKLDSWGFYPVGGGQLRATVHHLQSPIANLQLPGRGPLRRVAGLAVAANLPAHIPQRMANRARSLLRQNGVNAEVTPLRESAAGPGAGFFLTAEYENSLAGFASLGAKGKPSEQVAEEACLDFVAFSRHAGAAVDMHLADQLLLPLALAEGTSEYTTCRITNHLLTNAHVIHQFVEGASIEITGAEGEAGSIKVSGAAIQGNW